MLAIPPSAINHTTVGPFRIVVLYKALDFEWRILDDGTVFADSHPEAIPPHTPTVDAAAALTQAMRTRVAARMAAVLGDVPAHLLPRREP